MKDGVFELAKGFSIDKNFKLDDLKNISKNFQLEIFTKNRDFVSFKTNKFIYMGKAVFFIISFMKNDLFGLNIFFADERPKWSYNTIEMERKKKLEQDFWLKKILLYDPPYNFPWGTIESIFDPKSGFSSIVISFG